MPAMPSERRGVLDQDVVLGAEPVPTTTAVGVARPSASGQAITTAEIAKVSARSSGAAEEVPDEEGEHARSRPPG